MVNSYTAKSLKEALELRKNPELIPYAGGTDLMVHPNENAEYLFLHKVPQMKKIVQDDKYIRFGAACTFTEIITDPIAPQILKDACLQIAAPAIRNAGTIGGNIGNGSAKADSALIFMVTNSKLLLRSASEDRIVSLKDFYLGRKKLDLKPDELIVEILMPRQNLKKYHYRKVSPRSALAISRISFAGIISLIDGKIENFATAFGAVADVIIRPDDIDSMFIGKTVKDATQIKDEYIKAMGKAIVPIRGRVSEEYRKAVAMNLLADFVKACGI